MIISPQWGNWLAPDDTYCAVLCQNEQGQFRFKIEIPLVFTFQDKRLHTTTPKRHYFRLYASPVIFFNYLVKYEKMLIVVR